MISALSSYKRFPKIFKEIAFRGALLGGSVGCSIFFPSLQPALALGWTLLAFEMLTSFRSAPTSSYAGRIGMLCAIAPYIGTLLSKAYTETGLSTVTIWAVCCVCGVGSALGIYIAKRTPLTALPQLMALFHSLVGLAATGISVVLVCVNISSYSLIPSPILLEIMLGGAVGAITFTGSVFAVLRLQNFFRRTPSLVEFLWLSVASLGLCAWTASVFMVHPTMITLALTMVSASTLGVLMILPVAGADMPLVISLLNSCSGWACVSLGLYGDHPLLIVVGAIVGFSGAVLTAVMCKGMNRSLLKVFLGAFSKKNTGQCTQEQRPVQSISAQESAFFLRSAERVCIIPGYGAAVAQAQGPLQELALLLKENGCEVKYGMHPVAGRMPGHMDILLAQANVPLEDMMELSEVNRMLPSTDVVLIVGANDTVNPAAEQDSSTDIYGMPIFQTYRAKKVLFIKRSMNVGYSGIDNPLCYMEQTYMVFGDGKKVCEDILKAFSQL